MSDKKIKEQIAELKGMSAVSIAVAKSIVCYNCARKVTEPENAGKFGMPGCCKGCGVMKEIDEMALKQYKTGRTIGMLEAAGIMTRGLNKGAERKNEGKT